LEIGCGDDRADAVRQAIDNSVQDR
jgi:hypothetical protein